MSKNKLIITGIIITLLVAASLIVYIKYYSKKNEENQTTQSGTVSKQSEKKELWTCPMHPQVISDKPGVCPICNMELVKQNSDEGANSANLKNIIKLSDNKLILANVSTVQVKQIELDKQVSAYSYLDFADENRKVISAKFNGRIEKLFVNKTGEYVNKGQALFEVYSPDLVQAENDFIIALNSEKSMNNLLSSAKKKLLLFGLTDKQIKDLETKKEVKITNTYYSPIAGTIIDKKIEEGMYFNEGMALYNVADLSSLWNISEIYENDLNVVNVGNKVKLKLQAYPGEEFSGRITFIYPVVNSQTRTIKIRSEFANTKGKLKPQMYGETIIEKDFGKGLVVPSDAILFMGKRNIVWVKTGEGEFEAREVMVGMKIGDNYQILSGLKEGEEVAKTGGFLIDSESQLKTGNTSGNQKEGKKASGSMPDMPGMK